MISPQLLFGARLTQFPPSPYSVSSNVVFESLSNHRTEKILFFTFPTVGDDLGAISRLASLGCLGPCGFKKTVTGPDWSLIVTISDSVHLIIALEG